MKTPFFRRHSLPCDSGWTKKICSKVSEFPMKCESLVSSPQECMESCATFDWQYLKFGMENPVKIFHVVSTQTSKCLLEKKKCRETPSQDCDLNEHVHFFFNAPSATLFYSIFINFLNRCELLFSNWIHSVITTYDYPNFYLTLASQTCRPCYQDFKLFSSTVCWEYDEIFRITADCLDIKTKSTAWLCRLRSRALRIM